MTTEDLFVIWSIEHQAWWRTASWGYTEDLAEAGFYTQAEATRILTSANLVTINEAMIPARMSGLLARLPFPPNQFPPNREMQEGDEGPTCKQCGKRPRFCCCAEKSR